MAERLQEPTTFLIALSFLREFYILSVTTYAYADSIHFINGTMKKLVADMDCRYWHSVLLGP